MRRKNFLKKHKFIQLLYTKSVQTLVVAKHCTTFTEAIVEIVLIEADLGS